jgi:hypothetical protein
VGADAAAGRADRFARMLGHRAAMAIGWQPAIFRLVRGRDVSMGRLLRSDPASRRANQVLIGEIHTEIGVADCRPKPSVRRLSAIELRVS